MPNYFVSWRYPDYSGTEITKVQFAFMSGQSLADMYGFSDCTGAQDFKVWEFDEYSGELIRREIYGSCTAPFNWLVIVDDDAMEIARYEWPEH